MQRLGDGVHLPLGRDGGLRHAEAAERAAHGVVGVDEGGVQTHVGAVIGTHAVHREAADNGGAVGAVGAGVAGQPVLGGDQLAVLGGARLHPGGDGVTLGGDHGGLRPAADHLHGALGVMGHQGDVQLHADVQLAAEAAAGGGLDAADPVLGHAQHGSHFVPVVVGVLGGGDDGHDALLVIVGDAGVRLDEHMGEDMGGIGVLDDDVALVPGLVHVAELQVLLGVDIGGAVDADGALGQRGFVAVDDGELFVLHLDQLLGLLHDLRGLRGDDADGVAVAADLVVHQAGLVLDDDAEAVLAGDGGVVQDAGHAGQGPGLVHVQLLDDGMGNGGAEHAAVEHVGHEVVRGELRPAQRLVQSVYFRMVAAQNGHISHFSHYFASSPRMRSAASMTAWLILA